MGSVVSIPGSLRREKSERRLKENMKKQNGFSLIELLIVVAIILIIAAIAVPNLLRSRMAANESSAAGSERTIATSNVTYSTSYNQGFAADLSQLGPGAGGGATSAQADLIDSTLGCAVGPCVKSGYTFSYTSDPTGGSAPSSPNNTYTVLATPSTANTTGVSYFCVDQSNVVRKDPAGAAAPSTAGAACDDGTGTVFPPM
jgi:type IV pilus assembly protein PilA